MGTAIKLEGRVLDKGGRFACKRNVGGEANNTSKCLI